MVAAKVTGAPDHAIVVEYCPLSDVDPCGVAYATGAVIAIAAVVIMYLVVVMEFEALDATEVPVPLLAVTVNVYEVFGDSPVTEIVPEPA